MQQLPIFIVKQTYKPIAVDTALALVTTGETDTLPSGIDLILENVVVVLNYKTNHWKL
jgi:hypothetical protein